MGNGPFAGRLQHACGLPACFAQRQRVEGKVRKVFGKDSDRTTGGQYAEVCPSWGLCYPNQARV